MCIADGLVFCDGQYNGMYANAPRPEKYNDVFVIRLSAADNWKLLKFYWKAYILQACSLY